jgi:hypothetical protein
LAETLHESDKVPEQPKLPAEVKEPSKKEIISEVEAKKPTVT